jgi:hypothetical protein
VLTKKTLVGALAIAALAIGVVGSAPVSIARAEPPVAAEVERLQSRFEVAEAKVRDAETNLDTVRSDVQLMLWPVGILLAVLTIGGLLSVVFSIRDQRRGTQLHELAVRGETASQRRSEESFSAFLTESQKTLTLVNDTLRLAKESTDRASHAMEANAQARVGAIEADAEALMQEAYKAGEFEAPLDRLPMREEVGRIARELQGLEGYLELQNLALPANCRFVKALARFLADDTNGALSLLRHAEQEERPGDLRRFIVYWVGYIELTVGDYENARRHFVGDEEGMAQNDRQRQQLERMDFEAEFFLKAERREHAGTSTPEDRLGSVTDVLDKLEQLATRVDEGEESTHRSRTSHEVARTRADVYVWVARGNYDGATMPKDAQAALERAFEICEEQKDRDYYLEFTWAECAHALGRKCSRRAYLKVTKMLVEEASKHRETRREAELEYVNAICHARLAELAPRGELHQAELEQGRAEVAARNALETARVLAHGGVTIFSAMRRHNVNCEEFIAEVGTLVAPPGADAEERETAGGEPETPGL